MSKSFERGLLILRMIPHYPRHITSHDIRERLADEYDITVHIRTIQHDLTHIANVYPLQRTENDNPPRYYWPPDAQVELVPGHDDYSALTWNLLQQYLEPLLPEAMSRRAKPIFDTASRYLERVDRKQIRNWGQRVRMIPRSFALQAPNVNDEVQQAVYECLWEGEALAVDYLSRGAEQIKSMTLHPQGLIVREGVFYLVAQVEGYEDLRHFALHRIQRAESTYRDAKDIADFDLDAYLEQGAFSYPASGEVDLVLHCEHEMAKHLLEAPLAPDQTSQVLSNGWVEIKARVLDSQQLRWWIQGLGANVEVVGPASLREHFRTLSQQLLKRYQD